MGVELASVFPPHATERHRAIQGKRNAIEVVTIDLEMYTRHSICLHGKRWVRHSPIIKLGKSNKSLLMEKQNAQGTGAPFGFNSTQCKLTERVLFSKA